MRRTALAAALVVVALPLGLAFAGTGTARWHASLDPEAPASAAGPGGSIDHAAAAAASDDAGGCTLPDPTGTGGCVTSRTAHLVAQLRAAFGDLPMWCWDLRPGNPRSDHPHGRACDITFGAIGRFPTPAERAEGWAVANWLVANADPLEIAYVIWDGRIWSARSGWRTYTGGGIYNRAHPTGGHFDHAHVSVKP